MKEGATLLCIDDKDQSILKAGCVYICKAVRDIYVDLYNMPPKLAGGWYKKRFIPFEALKEKAETYSSKKVTAC